ncbi:MAG: hotdog fold thioesterase [Bacteroidia bacterium]|nr:hotdog fold thioesterase [Bacteroidia bacterium]NNJ54625.1 hotdog fold thioesterase [Bacteroidia bacterium]
MIPYKSINISQLNDFGKGTLSELLDMKVTDIGTDFLTMSMPVNSRVYQPLGLLHGGAVAALAENVASFAGNLIAGEKGKACVGLTLNTNHLKSVKEGLIYATAKPIHLGRSTQVWEVETKTEAGDLINVTRMTLAVIDK